MSLLIVLMQGGLVGCVPMKRMAGGQIEPPSTDTFSIVAVDSESSEVGIAVASRLVAAGAIVPFVKGGVGGIATQALANRRYGPEGLARLEAGSSPSELVEDLIAADDRRALRQVGVVAIGGEAASFTGDECLEWAGERTGLGYAIQGNILTGESVLIAMEEAYLATEGTLSERLLSALLAGEEAGGDRRGKQAAALVVARKGWGYGGGDDRFRDLRVDDHEAPVVELSRIYRLHRALFPHPVEDRR